MSVWWDGIFPLEKNLLRNGFLKKWAVNALTIIAWTIPTIFAVWYCTKFSTIQQILIYFWWMCFNWRQKILDYWVQGKKRQNSVVSKNLFLNLSFYFLWLHLVSQPLRICLSNFCIMSLFRWSFVIFHLSVGSINSFLSSSSFWRFIFLYRGPLRPLVLKISNDWIT